MPLRARRTRKPEPDVGVIPQPRPEPDRTAERSLRAHILATPVARQRELLEALAATNPALSLEDEPLVDETLAAETPEDETEPDLLGDMDEDYEYDPDGDFSEFQTDTDFTASWRYRDHMPGVPVPLPQPDLRIIEANRDRHKAFEVVVPQPAYRLIVRQGLRGSRRAENIRRIFEERSWRLWQIGRIIVERQRGYFESHDAYEAYLKLQPLPQDEVAQTLGLNKGSVNRLLAESVVQTPRFGPVALDLFFGPAGDTLGMRTDVLAAHIRELLKTEDPQRPYFSEQIRVHLQSQGLLPQTRSQTEKTHMERLLRRVMQDYNIASRAQRRRSNV